MNNLFGINVADMPTGEAKEIIGNFDSDSPKSLITYDDVSKKYLLLDHSETYSKIMRYFYSTDGINFTEEYDNSNQMTIPDTYNTLDWHYFINGNYIGLGSYPPKHPLYGKCAFVTFKTVTIYE